LSQIDVRQYWEKRFEGGPSLATVGWLGLGPRYNEWLYRVRAAIFRRRVRRALRERAIALQTARVLDVGSGSGFYIDLWRRLGVRDIQGCDLTTAAVEKLREIYPQYAFTQADIGEAALPDVATGYDAISCMDVLFHIVDDARYAQALRNCARLLRTGGMLIFSDNFLHAETQRGAHQVSRSLAEIEAALKDAGLSVYERRPMFVLMNAPVDADGRAIRRFWSLLTRVVRRSEATAFIAGMLLYPIELLLCSVLAESPSTELMICLKDAHQ
jgi:2-polyprenyl-3-methyl-5-hydroxy-6-metoxy-1,4-benzoquinol methylase